MFQREPLSPRLTAGSAPRRPPRRAEASAAAKLVDDGHLVRLWKPAAAADENKTLGLYRADSETQLDGLLDALPLRDWMRVAVTPLEPHPNDPVASSASLVAERTQP